MRRVEILTLKQNGTHFERVSTGETGIFHQFGTDYNEFESGPGCFTTAIIEMPDGFVRVIPADLVRFMVEKE